MKKIILILLWCIALCTSISLSNAVNFNDASSATDPIKTVSIPAKTWWTMEEQVESITLSIFKTLKIAIGAVLVVYIVYAWTMMIISMWYDEKQLWSAKRSIWHAVVGLLFINIPWTLYSAFSGKNTSDDVSVKDTWPLTDVSERNIFMNSEIFWTTLWSIINFLEIALVAIAIFIFVLNGIKIMISGGEDKNVSEAKNKILWSLAWLIFIGIMEVWRNFVFIWDFKWTWQDVFSKLANLALFFAGPIAIFFLSLAWYYYITSGWEEEKIKKAKSIIINTGLATLLLLWIYTFLLDLKTLNF